jgi:hypothetical protein
MDYDTVSVILIFCNFPHTYHGPIGDNPKNILEFTSYFYQYVW